MSQFQTGKYAMPKDYILALESLGYKFRQNKMNDIIYCNEEPITDGKMSILRNEMRTLDLGKMSYVEDAIKEAAYRNRFHPLIEYLDGLLHDGQDHISHFVSEYLTDSHDFAHVAIRKWMIGAVAKVYQRGQNMMLVIDGKQGVGKSTLARWLCPLPEFFIEGAINPSSDDHARKATSSFIWEVAELQATTRKSDKEALKNFISQAEHTYRNPYATFHTTKATTASFLGTINEDGAGFLNDPTGSRRYLIIKLDKIRHGYIYESDKNKLWAQAVAAYKSYAMMRASWEPTAEQPRPPAKYWELSAEEKKKQERINAQYQVESVVDEMIREFFVIDPDLGTDANMTSYEILQMLKLHGLRGSDDLNLKNITRALTGLGLTKARLARKKGRPTGFYGIKEA